MANDFWKKMAKCELEIEARLAKELKRHEEEMRKILARVRVDRAPTRRKKQRGAG